MRPTMRGDTVGRCGSSQCVRERLFNEVILSPI
uniref:Uncharacterized protein n=1 Tax=Anguilla anguilla TaxID=7936 RepID=A0A0E9VQQ2_ANGAN